MKELPEDLFYEIWEILAPHAFCDREATDWTSEIWSLLKKHLEEEYKGLERTVLQNKYDEEIRNRER